MKECRNVLSNISWPHKHGVASSIAFRFDKNKWDKLFTPESVRELTKKFEDYLTSEKWSKYLARVSIKRVEHIGDELVEMRTIDFKAEHLPDAISDIITCNAAFEICKACKNNGVHTIFNPRFTHWVEDDALHFQGVGFVHIKP